MFGLEKKKLPLKPTLFVVNIAGQDYQFAALSMREWEQHTAAEATALKAEDAGEQLKKVHRQVVVTALAKGGNETSMEDIVEMDVPLFKAIFKAIMEAHGMKLETKLGEASPR